VVLSVSKGEADLQAAINSLYGPLHQQPDSALRNCLFPREIPGIEFPRLVYERDNASRPVVVPFLYKEIAAFFYTPNPLNFMAINPSDHRWMTELEIQGYKLPRNPHLGSWIVRGPTILTSEARVGKYGMAYYCPNSAVFGVGIDEVLVRPTLSCPDALRF